MDLANTIDEFCEQGFERFFTWRRILPQIGVPGLTLLVVHQHVASAIGLEVSIYPNDIGMTKACESARQQYVSWGHMKICLECQKHFVATDWLCPQCGHLPDRVETFTTFAPQLAKQNDGFNPALFAQYAEIEVSHF